MSRSAEITSADGLAIVGTTPDRVADVLGSVLDGGPSYLTGSLGTGLGNPGSDIDIVVFTDGAQQGELPMMFFVDEVILDVQFFAADSVADACRAASSSWAELPVGRCSRSAAPPARLQKRLSRWCTATPLLDQTLPSVVKDDERASVHAALVRGAVEQATALAAMARLAPERHRGLYWQRAGRQLCEVAIRGRGDLFVGDKWLSAKLARSDVPVDIVGRLRRVRDAASFDAACAELGLPRLTGPSLCRLEEQPSDVLRLGKVDVRVVGATRACVAPGDVAGSLDEVAETHGPEVVFGALRNGVVRLRTDPERLTEVLW